MAQKLSRFSRRAPRYSVGQQDIRHLRLARSNGVTARRLAEAEIVNVSESGLAMRIPLLDAPRIGEYLMLAFTAPGAKRIAWYARVVRMEMPTDRAQWKTYSRTVVMGLEFHRLPSQFRHELRSGLQVRWEQLNWQSFEERVATFFAAVAANWQKVAIYMVMVTAAVLLLYAITRPSVNYDEKHPTPWGQRTF